MFNGVIMTKLELFGPVHQHLVQKKKAKLLSRRTYLPGLYYSEQCLNFVFGALLVLLLPLHNDLF